MNNRFPPSLQLYFGLLLFGSAGFFLTLFFFPPTGFYGFVVFVALGGFGVAANIFRTKRAGDDLVCPSGSNCNVVVNSRFSKFFSIPLEILGMLYFAVIAASYTVLIFAPQVLEDSILFVLALITMAAALFSIYLLFVQAFLLGEWCIWCILSAMFSLVIFSISFITFDSAGVPVYEFLMNIEGLLTFLKFFGYALGVGGSTGAVVLFFNFLKDLDINEKEFTAIKGIIEIVWTGFGLVLVPLLVSLVAGSLADASDVMPYALPRVMEMIVLLITGFTLATLMILYAPYLVFMPFTRKEGKADAGWLANLRRPTFIVGALVVGSWYYAFALNYLPSAPLSALLVGYASTLLAAICVALIAEERLCEDE